MASKLESEAAESNDSFDSKSRREGDALLGWGKGRGKNNNKLTGGSGDRDRGTAKYTEGPLGGSARSRMASYDSATTPGLPRCALGVRRCCVGGAVYIRTIYSND